MGNKCLVTKYDEVSDNDSLLKVGELRIHVTKVDSSTSQTQGFCFNANGTCELNIIGNGYFTDSTLSENNGTKMTLDDNNRHDVYVSNGDFDISILSKYDMVDILFAPFATVVPNIMDSKAISIDDLKYCTNMKKLRVSSNKTVGTLESLSNMTALNELKMFGSNVKGNLDSLKNLRNLEFIQVNSKYISGTGAVLSDKTSLTAIQLAGTSVQLDLSQISNLVNLTYIDGYKFSGNVSSLSNLSLLTTINSVGATFYGDISKLPKVVKLLAVSNYAGTGFSWTKRDPSSSIIAVLGSPKVDNLDAMLNDEAACTAQSGSGIYKNIEVSGTRTSASDAAVATLQSKGYTVSITPA